MAVIVRYIVVRDGVELEQVFLDKKEAEAYDKMLDAAKGLAELIRQGDLPIDVDPKTIHNISIFLAKNAQAVTTILKTVKPMNLESKPIKKPKSPSEPEENSAKSQKPPAKSKSKAV